MPLPHTLTYRKTSDDPEIYRISYDGVEIGSVSHQHRHVQGDWKWHWGVGIMPLMSHGGNVPSGDATSFEDALRRFKEAFTIWMEGLHPGDWQRNRDYMKAVEERRR